MPQAQRYTYALDIGTCKVAGLIVDSENSNRIVAAAVKEQEPGAMQDGQIHEIDKVAGTIQEVTIRLAKETSSELRSVAVAAAGRSLKTQTARAKTELNFLEELSAEAVKTLELQAVQAAQKKLGSLQTRSAVDTYLCVGYTVTRYLLDGSEIASPVGHQGSELEVCVLATFLPRIVVDSLRSACQAAGLQIQSMTLEPMAAISAVVPRTMRALNLALVDIGAGTSDIAITRGGTIVGYGMVPFAGNELTEALAEQYLLDFTEAERLKRRLSEPEVEVVDVLGTRHRLPAETVIGNLQEAICELAGAVASEIKRLNNGSPQAVLLIGGGSQIPGLTAHVARQLNLPETRVSVRDRSAVPAISGGEELTGPAAITPIGIAKAATEGTTLHFFTLTVAGHQVQIAQMHQCTVGTALLTAGIKLSRLYGRQGKSIDVTVNERKISFKGSMGESAELYVNGKPATFDTPVAADDIIEIGEAEDGEDAAATVADAIKAYTGASITRPSITVTVNGSPVELTDKAAISITRNGRPCQPGEPLNHGDKIVIHQAEPSFIVSDIFREIEFNLHQAKGPYSITINGETAGFTTGLSDGDEVEIAYKSRNKTGLKSTASQATS